MNAVIKGKILIYGETRVVLSQVISYQRDHSRVAITAEGNQRIYLEPSAFDGERYKDEDELKKETAALLNVIDAHFTA